MFCGLLVLVGEELKENAEGKTEDGEERNDSCVVLEAVIR